MSSLVAGLGTQVAAIAGADPSGHGNPSALTTGAQKEVEAHARQVLATPTMQAAIEKVKQLYAADPVGSTSTGKATIDRAANSIGAAAVMSAIPWSRTSKPVPVWATTAAHDYRGLSMPNSGFGIENPDNVYRYAAFDPQSTYEIHGVRHNPGPVQLNFEMRDGIAGTTAFTPEAGTQVDSLSDDNITFATDGSFTITVSADGRSGTPNHLLIQKDKPSWLIVRDLLNDWATENPVDLEIKRVSGKAAPSDPSTDDLANQAAQILSTIAPYWLKYFNTYIYPQPTNTLAPVRVRPGGRGQSTYGSFDLDDDQAMVITLDPTGFKSMGIQLTDPWAVAYEYRTKTSSLNTTQATPNPDGTYTYVISKNDPGIANWLDPDGHPAGLLSLRWQQSIPGQTTSPNQAVRDLAIVKLSDLPSKLPPGSPTVTPQQRADQQAGRATAYDHRITG
ncbi:hypothetical protein [Nocardia sp. NPDC059228]|uniref:hypothetical protein n=1 Tax=Nocardia sp. NPDC059228 TaxID=3346777 RepID=UPI00367F733D